MKSIVIYLFLIRKLEKISITSINILERIIMYSLKKNAMKS